MSINHIDIQAVLHGTNRVKPIEGSAQGYQLASQLAQRLEARGRFKVILSFHERGNEYDCLVGFHQADGDDWLLPDQEEYGQEAVLVLETGLTG